ncbi:HAD-IIB family hydrolase [Curvibacter sp. RS43]|uniref:HAD family hydrolase n=1 Tax=Curvibacter microcysteis TaxID=3026419 RepID=UPI0023612DBC|nr:HAD-IIB family hydrolase [Curvibacter sp. RS43]MDD0810267.1 HAD-IIB family hydrolase [Curvibacter sp. RS43]
MSTARPSLQALSALPQAALRSLRGVFTDIDDTLTTDGAITADALNALGALRASGLAVIAITGRPVGWSEPFASLWPVDAIVAENGAVALLTGPEGQLNKLYQADESTRAQQYHDLQRVLAKVEAEVPGARRATDSAGRETDIAIDHSEFTHLPPEAIAHAVQIMRAEGLNATVSSIHINGWYGAHNKLEGARWIVRGLFDRDLDREPGHWLYVGDSTNDQLMFEHFELSVGVANVQRFVPQLQHLPRYITPSERGAGFAEVAQAILSARALG